LYGGELWEEQAVRLPPFRYVVDPADPIAYAAGPDPLLLVASARKDGDLVLTPKSCDRVQAAGEGVFGRTTVIVVVDGR
jgi:hypothetical protein